MFEAAQRCMPLTSLETLRRYRAVWALELLGATEALREVAKGPPEARQTAEARAALERLGPR